MVTFRKTRNKFWWSFSFLSVVLLLPIGAYASHWFQNTIQTQDLKVFKLDKPSYYEGFVFNGCTNSSASRSTWVGKKCNFSLKITENSKYPSEVMLIVHPVDGKQQGSCIGDLKVNFIDALDDPNGFVEKLSYVKCDGKFTGMDLKQVDKTHYQLIVK